MRIEILKIVQLKFTVDMSQVSIQVKFTCIAPLSHTMSQRTSQGQLDHLLCACVKVKLEKKRK